jgi:phage repressor protein C with HTH and peptisase S24 domain
MICIIEQKENMNMGPYPTPLFSTHQKALQGTQFSSQIGEADFGKSKDLPILGRAQGGEEGNLVIEENPIDWTYRPADLQGVHGAFAVFVTGDSMVPKYSDQDIAYIHPTQKIRRGRYVLIETKTQGGFIKQFECWNKDTLIVRQFNPAKPLHFTRNEIRSIMLVIGSLDA